MKSVFTWTSTSTSEVILLDAEPLPRVIQVAALTPEVSHAPMSSLKDAAANLQCEPSHRPDVPKNKLFMSVTPPVSHVEIWPYVAAAAVASRSQAETAVRMLLSVIT